MNQVWLFRPHILTYMCSAARANINILKKNDCIKSISDLFIVFLCDSDSMTCAVNDHWAVKQRCVRLLLVVLEVHLTLLQLQVQNETTVL